MAKVGVILAGCGYLDGAEIFEASFTLLTLDQYEAQITCCAPRTAIKQVINHATQQPAPDSRDVFSESARIARGDIHDVANINAADLDALILPGGYGAAKNLCSFAEHGPDCEVHPDVEKLVGDILDAGKPLGAICIAPTLVARVAGKRGKNITLTIGNDDATAAAISKMGCTHQNCTVTEFIVDEANNVVSTPAYMLGPNPAAVYEGVRACVERVLKMIR